MGLRFRVIGLRIQQPGSGDCSTDTSVLAAHPCMRALLTHCRTATAGYEGSYMQIGSTGSIKTVVSDSAVGLQDPRVKSLEFPQP